MRFHVPEMSCGHCTATITKEITLLDPAAKVPSDVEQRFVAFETALLSEKILSATKAAGYEVTCT